MRGVARGIQSFMKAGRMDLPRAARAARETAAKSGEAQVVLKKLDVLILRLDMLRDTSMEVIVAADAHEADIRASERADAVETRAPVQRAPSKPKWENGSGNQRWKR